VIVSVYVPRGAVDFGFTVSFDFDVVGFWLKVAVVRLGSPPTDSETAPEKPLIRVIATL
jgi:hypothetical protein